MKLDNLDRVGPRPGSLLFGLAGVRRTFGLVRTLVRSPLTAAGTLVVLAFLLLALFGDSNAPYDYSENAFNNFAELTPYQPPDCYARNPITVPFLNLDLRLFDPFKAECKHPFGTDKLGYDVFSRVILGTREIFRLAGLGTLFADSLLSMPALLLALVLVGTLPVTSFSFPRPSFSELKFVEAHFNLRENSILIVLVVVYSPIVARVVRSNVLAIKTRGFVEAAQLRGESTFYILWREILPSVIPALVVEASLRFSYSIFLVASLGFLGLGANPPTPNWGLMVNDAYTNRDYVCNQFQCYSWTILYPALAIVVLVISVNLMSDGVKQLVQRHE
jgi:peptide/nickel transport system permease protein